MSYGLIFVKPEDRPKSNLAAVYDEMVDLEVRSRIIPPDPVLDRLAQRLGQRYNTGTDSEKVLAKINRLNKGSAHTETTETFPQVESNIDQKSKAVEVPKRVANPMRSTVATILSKKVPGEIYHVPKIIDPFEPPFTVCSPLHCGSFYLFFTYQRWYLQTGPSLSSYNTNTPKMWPDNTLAPTMRATKTRSGQQMQSSYNSDIRSHTGTQSFGHKSHSTTLKKSIYDQTGSLPLSATLSSRPCSYSEPVSFNDSYYISTRSINGTMDESCEPQRLRDNYLSTRNTIGMGRSVGSVKFEDVGESGSTTSQQDFPLTKSQQSLSKSLSMPALSELQRTLMQCGKLNLSDFHSEAPVLEKIEQGIAVQKLHVLEHASWLKKSRKTTQAPVHPADLHSTSTLSADNSIQDDIAQEYRKIKKTAAGPVVEKVPLPRSGDYYATSAQGLAAQQQQQEEAASLQSSLESMDHDSGIGYHKEHKKSPYIQKMVRSVGSNSAAESRQQSRPGKSSVPSKSRHTQSSGAIDLPNICNSENPFRQSIRSQLVITHARDRPRQPNELNPLDYKDEMSIKTMGNFNVSIKPSLGIGNIPSQSEVNETLMTLTRKALLSFSTRVIECGAALKALKDPRHPTPGLQAVLSLHKTMVNAAAANPNNWLLNRKQLTQVLTNVIPWLPDNAKHRLLLSFDAENTGLIRYVRISTTLLCCSEPAMTELASSLNRARNKIFSNNADNAEIFDFLGELIVISFIHSFYEECGGGTTLRVKNKEKILAKIAKNASSSLATTETTTTTTTTAAEEVMASPSGRKKGPSFGVAASANEGESDRVGVGMRLQDFVEAFTCCASCIEDELLITAEAAPVMQFLFELHQKNDLLAEAFQQKFQAEQEAAFLSERELRLQSLFSSTIDHDSQSDINAFGESKPRMKYTYKNGEHSICKAGPTDSGPLLKKPLRSKDSSLDALMNDPKDWRKNLPQSLRSAGIGDSGNSNIMGASSRHHLHMQSSQVSEYPSVVLGGDSIAWTQTGARSSHKVNPSGISLAQPSEITHGAPLSPQRGYTASSSSSASAAHVKPGSVDVLHIIKHGNLAAVKELPRISQDDLILAVKKHPRFLKEFIRQVRALRLAAQPYVFYGSVSIEDSINQFNRTSKAADS